MILGLNDEALLPQNHLSDKTPSVKISQYEQPGIKVSLRCVILLMHTELRNTFTFYSDSVWSLQS